MKLKDNYPRPTPRPPIAVATTKCVGILQRHRHTLPYIVEWEPVLESIASYEDVSFELLSAIYRLDVRSRLQDEVIERSRENWNPNPILNHDPCKQTQQS